MKRFKKGAASFYIVAISTLILVIIAASFAAVIISEMARTSNDDLAQSAYDSALAGVEDGKLAFYNYQNCLKNSADGCTEIINWFNKANDPKNTDDKCDMVAEILQRKIELDENNNKTGVLVQETEVGNSLQQAYTCVIVKTTLNNYMATLTSNDSSKVIRAHFDKISASEVKSIRVSWQSDKEDATVENSNFDGDGIFGTKSPVPPVISVGLVQTARTFNLSAFDMTVGDTTDRGTLYLVPVEEDSNTTDNRARDIAMNGSEGKYLGSWNGAYNYIAKTGFLKSNDKTLTNLPYAVYCANGNEFACSATMELPDPVGGDRNDDTFMVVVSMPYAGSSTDVKLEFCTTSTCFVGDDVTSTESTAVSISNTQVSIDSTGRANDLYRRVEVRLDAADNASPYPMYAIQLLGSGSGSLIKKDLAPITEWNF